MWNTDFDYRKVKLEVIELFKKNNLTFSQAYSVISSVRSELEKRSSDLAIN